MNKLQIIKPDDFHVHFRDGASLLRTVTDHAVRFARSLVMPNLATPVTRVELAHAYYERIQAIVNAHATDKNFEPLMSLYLTDQCTPNDIAHADAAHFIHAYKLYPANVTTGSQFGVAHIDRLYPLFEAMSETRLVLCIHGEVNDANTDVFDREARFIDTVLAPMVARFPKLKIVLEHITTQHAVDFIRAQNPGQVAATITPHHLALNRNDLLGHGLKPHYFCLPILKRREHQEALLAAATSNDAHFFLGTDSAPHSISAKQSACGCAGIYSGCMALELYAEIFEVAGALDKLENFASHFGAAFYGLPTNNRKITLVKDEWQVPESLPFADANVLPLYAGKALSWQISHEHTHEDE